MQNKINTKTKPFLRWAGGKNWLIKHLENFLPKEGFNSYIEPFLGGGSVFFSLLPDRASLSDLNEELIETYQVVQDSVHEVIIELEKFSNTKADYYEIRSKNYRNEIKKAARFIYLNQTSFNGIYRVNLQGKYNVPYGYREKKFLDEDCLLAASKALQGVKIISSDFSDSLEDVTEGDLVFVDPPYTVTHNDNGFIKYNSKLFALKDQFKLSEYLDEVQRLGAFYILTNAAHRDIKKIFKKPDNEVFPISRASLVGGKNALRGNYNEFVITNIDTNG